MSWVNTSGESKASSDSVLRSFVACFTSVWYNIAGPFIRSFTQAGLVFINYAAMNSVRVWVILA